MKKIISGLLIFIMIFSIGTNQIFATILNSNDESIVYVDGIKFKVYTKDDNTIVETVGLRNESKMVLYPDGKAKLELVDEKGNIKQLNLVINTLLEDEIDFCIKDENGVLKQYKDLNQLREDEYIGQAAAVIGMFGSISLSQFLWALLATCGTVCIAGYLCWELEKALEDGKVKSGSYYRAFRMNNKVYIGILKISYKTAVIRLKTGQDTYTWKKNNAKSIANSAGRGYYHDNQHGKPGQKGVYYNHYHPKNGAHYHSFYGYAYIYF